MTFGKTITTALFASAFAFATPAFAVTVNNAGGEEREITFDLGAEEKKEKVAAGKSVKGDCPEGCAVRVTGRGFDYMAKTGDELYVLEDLTITREKPSS
jgi:hypothetical protein